MMEFDIQENGVSLLYRHNQPKNISFDTHCNFSLFASEQVISFPFPGLAICSFVGFTSVDRAFR